LNLSHR